MTTTDTYLLLRALCDELARCGMRHACTSPGSRNTPIVLSLAREPRIRCWSHLDERCAGFFAVGAARADGRPLAVTATSGTAVANLMPAVVEAREAGLPMIVLSADRPAELREIGAGQTIDQIKLFGGAAKWFFEVEMPPATPENLRWMRTLACRAYWTAVSGRPGPVHLNLPLREPLVLEGELPPDLTAREQGRPYVSFPAAPPPATPPASPAEHHPAGRLVIVAGAGTHDPAAVAALAARAAIPLLADPLSGARRGSAAVAHYDLLLRTPEVAARLRPERVLRLGELPTSKALRAWLAGLPDVAQIAFDPGGTWGDPASVVGLRLLGPLPRPEELRAPAGWLEDWRRLDSAAAAAVEVALRGEQLSEPEVARLLGEQLPSEATMFVASSMPVRDVEEFTAVRPDPPRVLANRGANGIDGTVSSAFGAVAAGAAPVVLLIGDVALLHDLGGLLAARRLELPITIVTLNNDGGGIFDFLPISTQGEVYASHIATPHGLSFAATEPLFGIAHRAVATAGELRLALATALRSPRTTLIEVRTSRTENHALHQAVAERSAEALRELLSRPAEAASPPA